MAANILKNLALSVFLMLLGANGFSQYKTNVVITDIANTALKGKMMASATKLLSEVNLAFFENRKPTLDNSFATDEASKSLLSMWEMSIFRCYETQVIEKGLLNNVKGIYEVRNIPIFFKEAAEGDNYEETILVFNTSGQIDDIYISVGTNRVNEILKKSNSVTDLRRRTIITDFVENFRTAYNRKDIDFLGKVFSDDALIITGKVVKILKGSSEMIQQNINNEQIVYLKEKKSDYLNKMKIIFKNNSYINIKFDSLEVVQHGKYPEIYGVTLKQNWNTSKYSDVGYVFLMIDFKDESNPIIHVRTWQPDKIDGKLLPKDDVFGLGTFGNYNR
jgi:hypothetical protein